MTNMSCKSADLAKMRALIIAQRLLKRKSGITDEEIYNIRYDLDTEDKTMHKQKTTMNEDIKKYPIFILRAGKLVPYHFIKSTNDYNHYNCHLHHFIPKARYDKNPKWYEDRGIKQKLILLPICMHEQLHNQGIHPLTDAEFKGMHKIDKSELIFGKNTQNKGVTP